MLGQREAGAPGSHRATLDSQRARDQGHKGECPLGLARPGFPVAWQAMCPGPRLTHQVNCGAGRNIGPPHTRESPVSSFTSVWAARPLPPSHSPKSLHPSDGAHRTGHQGRARPRGS